ncbi:MAG: hypothetical protein AAGB14_04735 [Verrucomicrobiota bacterium]
MILKGLCLLAALLALGGCEDAKELLGKAKPASSGAGRPDVAPGGDLDPMLDKQVLRDGDGVVFRRDLPFPTRLEVRMKLSVDYENVRLVEVSALGKTTDTYNHETETEIWCQKNPGIFDFKLEKAARRVVVEGEEATAAVTDLGRGAALEGQQLRFALSSSGWRSRHDSGAVDFKKAVWADSLEGKVPQLMVETGAHPRAQWFSSSRIWRPGDQITLTGNALKILDPYDVSGKVTLKFEGVEAVSGHPCGVFAVEGDIRIDNQLQPDGSHHDCDIAVTSGKIWASLLYPVVLREEYETVQTLVMREGKKGGPEKRMQGAIVVEKARSWVPGG